MPALALSMRDISQNVNSIKLSEHTLEAGKFTHLTLTQAIQHFRRIINTPIQLLRSDFPLYNFTEMMNVIQWATPSYRKEKDVYTHFSLATPYAQSYPSNSINLVYASQIFSSINAPIHAPDTIFASLSEDKTVQNARVQQANVELTHILEERHKELIVGGRVVIDLAGEVILYDKSIYKLINNAIQSTVKNGRLKEDSLVNLAYPTHYRSYDELEYTLNSLKHLYRTLELREEIIPAPFYEVFKRDGSRLKYADDIMNYWASAVDMILRKAKQKGDVEDIDAVMEEIARYVFANVQMDPPVSEIKSLVVVLEKI